LNNIFFWSYLLRDLGRHDVVGGLCFVGSTVMLVFSKAPAATSNPTTIIREVRPCRLRSAQPLEDFPDGRYAATGGGIFSYWATPKPRIGQQADWSGKEMTLRV
jgi:hypothetical protein